MPEPGTVLLPLLADQGGQVTAPIGRDDGDGPRMNRRHGRDSTAQVLRGRLVLLLMANGGALPGAYRPRVIAVIRGCALRLRPS
jgi:hypothetical protein